MTEPRGLAVFDLDGTISRRDTFLSFVLGGVARHPSRWWSPLRVLPTALGFAMGSIDRGRLKGELLHATLGGFARRTIGEWALSHVERLLRGGVFDLALQRIRWHRDAGHYLLLMSASVDCYVPEIGHRLGFNETICTTVRWNADGTLDGRLSGPNCRGEQKLRQLESLRQRMEFGESWAYGDSRADLLHMQQVTHGVYVNGSPHDLPADAQHITCERWR